MSCRGKPGETEGIRFTPVKVQRRGLDCRPPAVATPICHVKCILPLGYLRLFHGHVDSLTGIDHVEGELDPVQSREHHAWHSAFLSIHILFPSVRGRQLGADRERCVAPFRSSDRCYHLSGAIFLLSRVSLTIRSHPVSRPRPCGCWLQAVVDIDLPKGCCKRMGETILCSQLHVVVIHFRQVAVNPEHLPPLA